MPTTRGPTRGVGGQTARPRASGTRLDVEPTEAPRIRDDRKIKATPGVRRVKKGADQILHDHQQSKKMRRGAHINARCDACGSNQILIKASVQNARAGHSSEGGRRNAWQAWAAQSGQPLNGVNWGARRPRHGPTAATTRSCGSSAMLLSRCYTAARGGVLLWPTLRPTGHCSRNLPQHQTAQIAVRAERTTTVLRLAAAIEPHTQRCHKTQTPASTYASSSMSRSATRPPLPDTTRDALKGGMQAGGRNAIL